MPEEAQETLDLETPDDDGEQKGGEPSPDSKSSEESPGVRSLRDAFERSERRYQSLQKEHNTLKTELAGDREKRERLVKALTGQGDEEPQGLRLPSDTVLSEAEAEYIRNLARETAREASQQAITNYGKERETQDTESRRRDLTNDTIKDFRADIEWAQDEDTWKSYVELFNKAYAGTGDHGSVTRDDLERCSREFRRGERDAEMMSRGQREALQASRRGRETRTPVSRTGDREFADMLPEEQADVLATVSFTEQKALMSKLPASKKLAVLRIIDPEVQGEPE